MNRGRGKKDRDNRSNGIEILMSDSFAKINPTDPFILAKQAAERSEIDPIPPLDHFVCLLYRRKRELKRGNEMVSVLLAAVKDKELNLEDVIIQSRCFTVSMF
jgi:hypothetical protein